MAVPDATMEEEIWVSNPQP